MVQKVAAATNLPGPPPLDGDLKISFLGPFGTFTEQAVWQVAPAGAQLLPATSAPQALEAVRNGAVDRAVVPIENSIEGGVNATIDTLSRGENLHIVAEMIVPVRFVLAARPGTTMADIRTVGTHPHAWAQCRIWSEETLPNVVHVPTTSTAAAAELLGELSGESAELPFDAALCNATSVERYGLVALVTDVADNPGAVTRFIMAARPGSLPPATGADKTTIRVSLPSDEAGALLMMLEQFSVRGVNLSRIESRPSGNGLGHYDFSIDIAGHVAEERVQAALVGLHRTCPSVQFLGSYPRVDGVRADVQRGTHDTDFVEARAWVDGLTGRLGHATTHG
ncbi:prephenate dehydratase [Actinomyces minihominis]|uniref:prephenate dehydratase n=1 Tax=Actinomyces minihominis TaxID=2002838 RepID=UPI000C0785B3|nr:prephenate dehydratase [Actinomyces minihominis]